MTKTEIAKKTVSVIVGIGSGKIVSGIVSNNTAPDGVIDKITIPAASAAIGGIVAQITGQYTDHMIDAIVTWWDKNVTK